MLLAKKFTRMVPACLHQLIHFALKGDWGVGEGREFCRFQAGCCHESDCGATLLEQSQTAEGKKNLWVGVARCGSKDVGSASRGFWHSFGPFFGGFFGVLFWHKVLVLVVKIIARMVPACLH